MPMALTMPSLAFRSARSSVLASSISFFASSDALPVISLINARLDSSRAFGVVDVDGVIRFSSAVLSPLARWFGDATSRS